MFPRFQWGKSTNHKCCDASYKIERLLQKAELGSTCATCCRNLQHRNLLRGKLGAKVAIRATTLFNLQCNNVALQVERKCCPYFLNPRASKMKQILILTGYPTRPLRISRVGPAFRYTIYPLFSKLVRSRWMNVGHAFFQPRPHGALPGNEVVFLCVFRLTETKGTSQYPAILTSRLANKAYSLAHSR